MVGSLTPLKNCTIPWPSFSSNKSLLSLPILVFPSISLLQVGSFFHRQYLYSIIFRFSFPVPLISWEVFYRLISCPVLLLSLSIIGLGGFSPVTWPFGTYQLTYEARIFSMIFRCSSPVFLIGLGGFSWGSHLESWVSFLTYVLNFSSPDILDSSLSTPWSWQGIYIKAGRIFHLGIYRLSTCRGMRPDHLWASPSNEKWPVR